MLGEELADICDAEALISPALLERCRGCAFRRQTPANQSVSTIEIALQCVILGEKVFHCHTKRERVCAGYLLMKKALGVQPTCEEPRTNGRRE